MFPQLAAMMAAKDGGGGGGGGGMMGGAATSSAESTSGGTNTGPVVTINGKSAMAEAVPWLVGGVVALFALRAFAKRKG